jgi:UDP-N-acetylglucosamine--N-acetylmuramyl-(pentapeptide) pyrophosphoryl-undecaprenol N-acetylglucosamine transferase
MIKLVISGGGTVGSVMPLVTIANKLRRLDSENEVLFIGTRHGHAEKEIIAGYNFYSKKIFCGKLRRYFDLRNLFDVVPTLVGFFQSLVILANFKPDVVMGAGGYVSVPVIWAAWLLRKKILIHQQDLKPSLSNILVKSLADKITVSFEKSLDYFPLSKTSWTGNPAREDLETADAELAYKKYSLEKELPLVLIIGGSSGAVFLNSTVLSCLPKLLEFCQVIHITGFGKKIAMENGGRFKQFEFITDDLVHLMKAADLVVSRAGLSVITELSFLKKPAIIIPIEDSHQEDNALFLQEQDAASVIFQHQLSPSILLSKISGILNDKNAQAIYSQNISRISKPRANDEILEQLISLIKK